MMSAGNVSSAVNHTRHQPWRNGFIVWHVIYTLILAAWAVFAIGGQCGLHKVAVHFFYWIGLVPSIVLLILGYVRANLAFILAAIYGALVGISVVALFLIPPGFVYICWYLPLIGFAVEALVLIAGKSAKAY